MRQPKITHVIALLATLITQITATAQEQGEAWIASLGGKLYDNHWIVTGNPVPETRNPDYPKDVDVAVGNTWRCVSCHGWDYLGKDGHLGEVSSSSTFANLSTVVGKDPVALKEAMLKPKHSAYLAGLAQDQVEALAYFLSL